MTTTSPFCPCGSGLVYDTCCRPLHQGEREAESAEALMRSRYAAFALGGLGDYLLATWHDDAPAKAGLDAAALSRRELDWRRLEVLAVDEQGARATVEFRATFSPPAPLGAKAVEESLHERSRFVREEGRWRYLDGEIFDPARAVKQGRNAPCLCGSGRKYKHCCAQR
ncbi:YchJ family protein [Halotalea alkalilenta]|uniref:YchJ family protein n=1 Tax=Halotalea alkalilenta TaxID=376489 RepID=UPI0004800782|nr:YchJ family protein [Halotalea alkalilenta]